MTKDQIKASLDKLNEKNLDKEKLMYDEECDVDTWISLKGTPIIYMEQDGHFYSDVLRTRYFFDYEKELMYITYGKMDKNGVFVDNEGNTDDYKIYSIVDFSHIGGFINSVYPGPAGSFYRKL